MRALVIAGVLLASLLFGPCLIGIEAEDLEAAPLLAQDGQPEDEAEPVDLPYTLPSVGVSAGLGVLALFLTQALKGAMAEEKHRYIPIGLIVVLPAIGVGLAAATGNTSGQGLVQGGLEGVVAAWAAVYGYQAQKGIRGQ